MATAELPMPTASLTLYSLNDELAQLIAVRADMVLGGEDTAACDTAIAEYMQALPDKVDATAHVIQTLESQAALAKLEEERLHKRRVAIQDSLDRLKDYVCDVLAGLPKPARGSRKLEGSTASLVLVGNGGARPLEVQDPAMVPEDCKVATVQFPARQWASMRNHFLDIEMEIIKERVEVSNSLIRKALEKPCWICDGKDSENCEGCGGTGCEGVPGARLLERGSRLEVR